MKVLIAGGTGFVGTALAAELHARGHDVTALSRSPDESALPPGVATVAADVTDADAVRDAVERTNDGAGLDAVVNLVALSPLFRPSGGDELHERVHFGGTENLVRAAESHGVDRYLQLSALGADPDGPTHYIRAKGRAEAVVRESTLAWTVVRPSVVFGDGGEFVSFTKTLTTPFVTGLPGGGSTRFQPIWIGDLVPMLADCLDGDGHAGQSYEVGGPDVLTLAEVAKLIYRADGKPLAVLRVPMALAKVGLTLAELVPGIPMGRDQYRSLRFDNTVVTNDVIVFGREQSSLTTLSTYLDGGVTSQSVGSVEGTQSVPNRRPGEKTSERDDEASAS